ncbi:aldehyde dehydrogenase [Nocardioides sp. Root1257]|uniref:aldehyde dehydrogenase family protein n=1 Tax=unclassified Nocardioides TaxID=2615069 RepID=UPI0006FEE779|nr:MULTISPECIES: aldehyde dehydrogenase family protein [unclassified Nocardioides]KQW45009.1 aldehyde dehydrogenase [Nocardioides sp. Root1257]KRC45987.1 aldehyde dehydrogenase [Nocardioides sp. Root224]
MSAHQSFDHQLDVDVPAADSVFIGGEWRAATSTDTLPVIDPATEQLLTRVAKPSIADADAAVSAARDAFDRGPWPRMSPDERIDVVQRFCHAIESRLDQIVRAVVLESGVTLAYSQVLGAGAAPAAWNASLDAARKLPWESRDGGVVLRREPVGTVLAVLTYNGPVSLVGMKVVPALLAGCPVIVKHAPESQLSAHLIADAALEAGFPTGVLSFLPAETDVTQHLVSHPGIDMVTVTGSQAIARDVVARTSQRLARTALELGGKSPAIVGEDTDVAEVMATLGDGATAGTGQVCVLLSRVLVPRSRYDEFADAFIEFLASRRLGDPFSADTDLGPLSVERARDRTEKYVEVAIADGAKLAVGGKRPSHLPRGYYFEPTLFTDVRNDMRIAQEEVFGPITTLIAYDDIEDAIRIANDTDYGLAASVYMRDPEEAADVARRIRSGTVAINQAGMSLNHAFGGVKQSGWGRECGPEGILEFTDIKQMLLPSGGSFLSA